MLNDSGWLGCPRIATAAGAVEAMSASTPIVATNVGGVRGCGDDGERAPWFPAVLKDVCLRSLLAAGARTKSPTDRLGSAAGLVGRLGCVAVGSDRGAVPVAERPLVQLGLDLQYSRLGLIKRRPRIIDIHQRTPDIPVPSLRNTLNPFAM